MSPNQLFFGVLTHFLLFVSLNAARVQFYQNANHTGLLYESSSVANCTNFPHNALIHAKSIKTDTCLWTYNYPNCDFKHWSKKYIKDTAFSLVYHFGSFHFCNATKIEPQLNIDITAHYTGNTVDIPVLHRYDKICSCVNVPNDVQEMNKWSINSNENDFIGYFEQNCSEHKWNSMYFEASSWKSVNMQDHFKMDNKTKYKIQSFGPLPNSTYFKTSCNSYYMYSWIMQLEKLETLTNTSLQSNLILTSKSLYKIERNQPLERDADRIVFFSKPNFRGTHLEISSKTGCHNLPETNNNSKIKSDTGSLKTYTCIMIYSSRECTGRSIKVPFGEITNITTLWELTITGRQTLLSIYEKFPNWKWNTGSFKACNDDFERKTLNIDITEYYPDYATFTKPVLYESFRNVCSCQNIPYNIQIMEKWSIDNHENSMIAYFEHDCQSKPLSPLWIPAGRSSYSMGFGEFRKLDENTVISQKIQSFGPDPDAEYFKINCVTSSNLNYLNATSEVTTAPVLNSFDTSSSTTTEDVLEANTLGYENILDLFNTLSRQLDNINQQQIKNSIDLKSLEDKITDFQKHEKESHELLIDIRNLKEKVRQSENKLENCEKRSSNTL